MSKYDCTLYGIRVRAEERRAKEREIAKYESIHKLQNPNENPVENRNENRFENGTGIQFTFWQELISAIIFYACIYLYWFVN